MVGPPSPLTASSATLNFLDFAASFIDKAVKANQSGDNPPQEQKELEREGEKLREIDSSHDLPNGQPSDKSNAENKQTESENGVQKVYERCKALADRLVPALLACETEGKDGKKTVKVDERRKGDIDKHRREIETLKSECAAQLHKLLSMSMQVHIPG